MHTLPRTLIPFIWFFLRKHWKLFLGAQVTAFAWSLDHTLYPVILMLVIDKITHFSAERSEMWSFLMTPIIYGIVLWFFLEFCFRTSGILLAKAIPKLQADIRMAMFEYVQEHSHDYFSNNFAGSISNKIADMPSSVTRILLLIITLFFPVALALLIALFLFYKVSGLFAFILFVWLVLHIGITVFFSRQCARYADIHAETRSVLAGKIVDSLSNNVNVRLFSRHRYESKFLNHFQQIEKKTHWDSLWYIEKMKMAMGVTSFFGPFLAMNWAMLYSWQQTWISTGELVYIFNTCWNITMMAWVAGLELPTLYGEVGVCNQALSIIQEKHDIVDKPGAKPLKIQQGVITFENVTFNYFPDQNIFENKNMTIKAGEKVGLVGFSGSGKTTFVHLILRYFDVEKGRILIDGQDISEVTQNSLRSQIALIPQDTTLFHRTLFENIRYGNLDATEEDVMEASKQAHCQEFIDILPAKYDTIVGERGMKLSGGQRQRIAIARAILKNSPILILDEATSALDSVTERHIQNDLQNLMEGRTSIVIAHRLSTLSGMDRILVFSNGQIIEEGSHEKLLAAKGHYAEMWEMQAGGFLPELPESE
jgi:ATP-binding cassette, subfamily B, bacterial